jgi:hypothetical protein
MLPVRRWHIRCVGAYLSFKLKVRCSWRRGLPAQLEGTAKSVKSVMVAEMLERTRAQMDDALIAQITTPVRAHVTTAAGSQSAPSQSAPALSIGPASEMPLRDALYPLVVGMHRLGQLPAAYKAMQIEGCEQLKLFLSAITQQCLELFDEDHDASHLLPKGRASGPDQPEETQFAVLLQAVLVGIESYISYCSRCVAHEHADFKQRGSQ